MLLEQLKTFTEVAERKNFTKAGEALNLAQPTVSLHIRQLEEEFGTPLFIRSRKQFSITPAGRLLYEKARQLLALAEETKEDMMRQSGELTGTLTVAASYTIGEYVLPRLLENLLAAHPKLEVIISISNTEEVEAKVREFRCDVGCIEGTVRLDGLTAVPFMEDELIVVCGTGHPLARMADVSPEELQQARWITREEGSGTREHTDHLLRSLGHVKPARMIIGSNGGVIQAVVAGLGVAAVSVHAAKDGLETGQLVQLDAHLPPQKRTFSILHAPAMAGHAAVSTFLKTVAGRK
ncbi:LysR family transcriptional regulator [Bhargavaea ginsengi]|uniref:LysR family transcriptional regulator n=1 Tax=Bhargavaea ginsengi TaxID=426757 RepID=UPI00203B5076|nr:LysR family transcriptional regulator [Bhargavaea ginsengi]MCM3088305.1 LysR family transcriptional regulator [Bhargavaea ginsengi]